MSPPNQVDSTNFVLEAQQTEEDPKKTQNEELKKVVQGEVETKAEEKAKLKRTVYYSPHEVSTHNKSHDIWVIMNGSVYDITNFLPNHPGGDEIVLEHAGLDITEVFKSAEIHQHSSSAFEMLRDHKIGGLENSTGEEDIFDTDNEYDHIIDLEKAVVTQMWSKKLSLEVYLKLTHTPHFMKDGKIARLFENEFLEYASRNSWYNVLIWIPVAFYLLSTALPDVGNQFGAFLFFAGIIVWTLFEYLIHRFIFHMDGLLPDHHFFICLHFLLHGVHHFLPMDRMRLVFPPTLAVFVIAGFMSLFHSVFSPHIANALLAGGIFGYTVYDLGHYYVHHSVPKLTYLKNLKSYHLDHHYKNYHLGYGVSSKAWDLVFGTTLPAN